MHGSTYQAVVTGPEDAAVVDSLGRTLCTVSVDQLDDARIHSGCFVDDTHFAVATGTGMFSRSVAVFSFEGDLVGQWSGPLGDEGILTANEQTLVVGAGESVALLDAAGSLRQLLPIREPCAACFADGALVVFSCEGIHTVEPGRVPNPSPVRAVDGCAYSIVCDAPYIVAGLDTLCLNVYELPDFELRHHHPLSWAPDQVVSSGPGHGFVLTSHQTVVAFDWATGVTRESATPVQRILPVKDGWVGFHGTQFVESD